MNTHDLTVIHFIALSISVTLLHNIVIALEYKSDKYKITNVSILLNIMLLKNY